MLPRAFASRIAQMGVVLGALFIGSVTVRSALAAYNAAVGRPVHLEQVRIFRGARGPAAEVSGVTTLQRMLNAEMQINSDGEQVTHIVRNGILVISTQHVTRRGDSGLKIVWESPLNMQGSLTVDNGDQTWHLDAAHRRLKVSASHLRRREVFGQRMLAACRRGDIIVATTGSDVVAGRPCTVVEIRHRTDPLPAHIFWVDDATGFPLLKIEEHARDGSLTSTSYYTTINLNVTVPPGTFAPPNPPNVYRIQAPLSTEAPDLNTAGQQAGFNVLTPDLQALPPGYHYVSVDVSDFQRRKMVEVRYGNGFDVLSVFETPAIGFQGAYRPPPHVATAVRDGIKIVLVGTLPRPDLNRIVSSIR